MIFFFAYNLVAQSGGPKFVNKITVENSEDYGFHYNHEFKAKETVYSLSKMFGTTPDEIFAINPGVNSSNINLGQIVRIPIRSRYIIVDNSRLKNERNYIPVHYKVQPKENLYRIARHYFNQPVKDLMAKNEMAGNDLSPGQSLLVGYISRDMRNYVAEQRERTDSINLIRKNNLLAENVDSKQHSVDGIMINEVTNTQVEKILKKTRAKAMWDTKSTDRSNLFVLHSSAKQNSYIELLNPMLDRKVFAKVVGKVPENIYPADVGIIVSPKVASMLGAKDAQFLVEMKFLE